MLAASEPIVVDTSPLLALSACGHTELLRALHSRVVVPQAVITEPARGEAGVNLLAMDTERPAWLEVVALRHPASPLKRTLMKARRRLLRWR